MQPLATIIEIGSNKPQQDDSKQMKEAIEESLKPIRKDIKAMK